MDCGDDGRSLPGMWARRSDRLDYLDICASPPSDGFFYASQHRMNKQQQTAIGGCVQEAENHKNAMGQNFPKLSSGDTINPDGQVNCFNSGTNGLFKSFTPAYQAASGDSDLTEEASVSRLPGKVLNMNSGELEQWATKNIHRCSSTSTIQAAYDDSASTPVDHLVSHRNPVIMKTEEGGSLRLVDKLGTPDVTPCTTPAVTPACSPQVPRKSGNPFFAGDPGRKDDGSWLFRPGPKNATDTISYEARVDIQPQTSSQPIKKTVRYVPRPSQLRELNFWSPTSM